MRSRKSVLLLSIAILTLGSCKSAPVEPILPCPDRPVLNAIPEDLQLQTPPDVLFLTAENQLLLKEYAKKLEVRAGCNLGT